jgi:hypothetical protein
MFGGQSWSAPSVLDRGGGDVVDVSCPTASFCAAADSYDNAVLYR